MKGAVACFLAWIIALAIVINRHLEIEHEKTKIKEQIIGA